MTTVANIIAVWLLVSVIVGLIAGRFIGGPRR